MLPLVELILIPSPSPFLTFIKSNENKLAFSVNLDWVISEILAGL